METWCRSVFISSEISQFLLSVMFTVPFTHFGLTRKRGTTLPFFLVQGPASRTLLQAGRRSLGLAPLRGLGLYVNIAMS